MSSRERIAAKAATPAVKPQGARIKQKKERPITAATQSVRNLRSQLGGDSNSAAGHIVMRNEWYRDMSRRLASICLILLISLIGTGIYAFNAVAKPVETRYFAISPDGKLTKLTALKKAALTPAGIKAWAATLISTAYGFDFKRYREQLGQLEGSFTKAGYESYLTALSDTGLLQSVVDNRYLVSAVVQESPVITASGVNSKGKYTWVVEAPVLVTYESATDKPTQLLNMRIRLTRVYEIENPLGIAADQFIASRAN